MTTKQSGSDAPKTDPGAPKSAAEGKLPTLSKSALIVELLKRQEGATLEQMMEASGWQKHSVRGFLAGSLKKRHKLIASSEKTEAGRVYRTDPTGAGA